MLYMPFTGYGTLAFRGLSLYVLVAAVRVAEELMTTLLALDLLPLSAPAGPAPGWARISCAIVPPAFLLVLALGLWFLAPRLAGQIAAQQGGEPKALGAREAAALSVWLLGCGLFVAGSAQILQLPMSLMSESDGAIPPLAEVLTENLEMLPAVVSAFAGLALLLFHRFFSRWACRVALGDPG